MVTTTSNPRQLIYRGGYGKETIAPGIRDGLPGGAGSLVSLLVASYGWDLIVGLFLTRWLSASRASEPPP